MSRRNETDSALLTGLLREAITKRRSEFQSQKVYTQKFSIAIKKHLLIHQHLPNTTASEGATSVSRRNETDSALLTGLLREAITKRRSGFIVQQANANKICMPIKKDSSSASREEE